MGSLDLTLESELTLFRNRHSRAGTVQSPTSADESAENAQSQFAASSADDLVSEAARLVNSPFEAFENDLEESHIEESYSDSTSSEGTEPREFSYSASSSPSNDLDSMLQDLSDDELPTGAIVPSKALLPSEGALAGSATLSTYTDPVLDDYLESSEELLKHLDTPSPQEPLDTSVSLKWFVWAAGATLVLSLLAAFFLQNAFKTPEAPPKSSSEASAVSEPEAVKNQDNVSSPDLSSREFQTVKPGNLAELPAPADTETESSDRQYYVVTEYVDQASLEAAQKVVPDARVVNFTAGTRIQLRQLADESAARDAVAELQQQGLTAEILVTAAE